MDGGDGRRRRSTLSKKKRPTLQDSSDSEPEFDGGNQSNKGQSDKGKLDYSPEKMKAALKQLAPALKPPIDISKSREWKDVESMNYRLQEVEKAEEIVDTFGADVGSIEFRCLLCEASLNLSKATTDRKSPQLKRLYKKVAGLISSKWLKESIEFYQNKPGLKIEAQQAHCVFIDRSLSFTMASHFSESSKFLDILKDKRDMPWEELAEKVQELGRKRSIVKLVGVSTKAKSHFKKAREGGHAAPAPAPAVATRNAPERSSITGNGSVPAAQANPKSMKSMLETKSRERREMLKTRIRATGNDKPSLLPPGIAPPERTNQNTGTQVAYNPPRTSNTPATQPQQHQGPVVQDQTQKTYKVNVSESDMNMPRGVLGPSIFKRWADLHIKKEDEPLWKNSKKSTAQKIDPSEPSFVVFGAKTIGNEVVTKSFKERELDHTDVSTSRGMAPYQRPQDIQAMDSNVALSSWADSGQITRGHMAPASKGYSRDWIDGSSSKRSFVDSSGRGSEQWGENKRQRNENGQFGSGGRGQLGGRQDYSSGYGNRQSEPAFNRNDEGRPGRGRGVGRTMPAWKARQQSQEGQAPPGDQRMAEARPPAFNGEGPPTGGGRGRGRGRDLTLPAWKTRDQS